MAKATPVILDPYDGKTGLLLPFLLERVRDMAREHQPETDPTQVMANIGSRVYNGDSRIKVLAFVDDRGKLVGHAVAMIETDGRNHWLFVHQLRMDPGEWGDVVTRATKLAESWAQEYSEKALAPRGLPPITLMVMATHRDDKAWHRKHGWATFRHVMKRDIGPA